MPYVVMIEIEEGEITYVSGKRVFEGNDEPKYFNTREEAEREAKKWNTGRVLYTVGG